MIVDMGMVFTFAKVISFPLRMSVTEVGVKHDNNVPDKIFLCKLKL